MFTKIHNMLSGWLTALTLVPVVGLGQARIITPPEDATVCTGETAVFTSEAIADDHSWRINGISVTELGMSDIVSESSTEVQREGVPTFIQGTLTINYDEFFTGAEIQSIAGEIGGAAILSNSSYLFYKTNQQFSVIGLTHTISNTTAQFDWNEHSSNITVQYLFGVYDGNDNLIANQTTNATHISYALPPRVNGTCQYLEFRVTADQCPDPGSSFNQTESATLTYTSPNVSPVTVRFDKQMILVNWTGDSSSDYLVIIIDLDRLERIEAYDDEPPYGYRPPVCGQYKLDVSVLPYQCGRNPAFTHHTSISFTIPCPTTATTETEVSDEPSSGTQAISSSLLLVVTAIPLLKWQH